MEQSAEYREASEADRRQSCVLGLRPTVHSLLLTSAEGAKGLEPLLSTACSVLLRLPSSIDCLISCCHSLENRKETRPALGAEEALYSY